MEKVTNFISWCDASNIIVFIHIIHYFLHKAMVYKAKKHNTRKYKFKRKKLGHNAVNKTIFHNPMKTQSVTLHWTQKVLKYETI